MIEAVLVSAYLGIAAIVSASLLSQSAREKTFKSNAVRVADGVVCIFVGLLWLPVIVWGVLVWFDREVMS